MVPAAAPPLVVSVRGRAGVLAVIPALLGFHPENSLVLLGLSGVGHRAGPVLRIDLPAPGESARPMVTALLSRAARQVGEAVVVGYPGRGGSGADRAAEPLGDPVAVTARALRRVGTVVLDAFWATPTPADPDLAAALALRGRRVLADRAALAASVAGPTGEAATAAGAAFDRAADGLLTQLSRAASISPHDCLDQAELAADRALVAVEQTGAVDPATAAEFALHVFNPPVRDALIGRALAGADAPWLAMLTAVARTLRDRDAVAVLSMLALVAFRHGDGALADVALERGLGIDPAHRLSRLLAAAMDAGLTPDRLDGLVDPTAGPVGTPRSGPRPGTGG